MTTLQKLMGGKPTFESITSGLSNTIQQLDELAAANAQESIQKSSEIHDLELSIDQLNAERDKATKVAGNLRQLVGE